MTSWKGNSLGQATTDIGAFLKDVSLFEQPEFGAFDKDARAMAILVYVIAEEALACYMPAANFDKKIFYGSELESDAI
ncbi:uncharacterized protein FOMMEDRAFT_159913 [Fomitiporia mediterranea MF3/22]|uniref:uncharacterized protein n=1 Tax=Fomitiporia mediterranea (strain MF3/22) TaxID=694068 RepID=UPI0004407D2F|nr:uncharacterized protein FOMMEDRAFT_159913 [Fomitiporia mediterranea MF3/22]EJD00238.1 hypothetical protein FOMMEDRAFT_159913 [Fomitiporia mediterranea MF3/22]